MTHPTWELPVNQLADNQEEKGALVLTPCPGTKGVSLIDTLTQFASQGVKAIVTAINHDEMQSKGVESLGEEAEKLGIRWFYAPIEDDCAPGAEFAATWSTFNTELHDILAGGGKIALHCMGGSGRTGLLAAHVLIEQGWTLTDIIEQVQALRPGAFTKPVQVEYIQAVAK
ncbi:phosphatase [Photobacterium ganghwense]|uniref:Phosphatase n=1 Tax=Photobacterium ganghwense TaxID=320778 RepID=A0A0J1K882_9GAMM|nr:cyclin-dependent kinase inhibitor 3 family protein [Photobacterium ganghwense]KLV10557.1 phosphatase [Photobacterium ganghwense]PSU09540.1 phosphatase [Photobacterium ganghwense]